MRLRNCPILVLIFFLSCCAAFCLAQAVPDAAYAAKRQKAADLFKQGKRLEALPLLEEVVKTNPRDDEMLVALAACLVDHAATLTDAKAAGQERFRARDLLDQAWNLGNTSPLAMNLSELLKKLPESGEIKFSDNPAVEKAMRAGEAAFSRREFDEAIKDYSKALELDPKNYTAALFIGNTYDRQNEFAKGAEWYERAIQLDPNIETAYRYYADMLAKQGDMVKARTMLIHAAVAEPYNRMVWRELHAWATITHTQIQEIYIGIPEEQRPQQTSAANPSSPDASAVWQAYRQMKAKWQQGEFKKHFPAEEEYRHSLPEESEALTAAANVLESDKKAAVLVSADQSLALLLRLYQAGVIDSYVLFSLGDTGISRDYAAYRAKHREKLEEYMNKFVVPALPSQTSAGSTQPR
jgi:tetratricopeptide (TPR) repeat protein